MRVLGIDPGLTRCGLGVVEFSSTRRLQLVDFGVARTGPRLDVADRVHSIGREIATWLDEHRPDAVAMERVFAQQNLHTVMGVAQISGVAFFEARERGLPIVLYTPTQVKAAVSGYGQADKKQVQFMVQRLLKMETVPQPADAADALAIAICHCWAGARTVGNGSGTQTGAETPAQAKWRAAESRAKE